MVMLSATSRRRASRESAGSRGCAGRSADDYEVLAPLGAGTFGSVWRVRDLSLGREVALKVLHPHVARDERAVGRFRREAKLAAQLAHPAIVPIYDWDSRGDVAWYTMELAEDGSVADLVARAGPRPLAEIAPQVDCVLDGLAAAHAMGIIHRDLKPENMLIDRYRRWRIADFGIANVDRRGDDRRVGHAGVRAARAAARRAAGRRRPTASRSRRSSSFALTGEAPFGDQRREDDSRARARGRRSISRRSRRRSPSGCGAAFSRRPDDRFPDAAAMQAEWREAAARRARARAATAVVAAHLRRSTRRATDGGARTTRSRVTRTRSAP